MSYLQNVNQLESLVIISSLLLVWSRQAGYRAIAAAALDGLLVIYCFINVKQAALFQGVRVHSTDYFGLTSLRFALKC